MRMPLTESELDAWRRHLTTVATRLFVKDGVEALSLRSIGAAAGMSRSTPYGYFANKAEIVDSIRAAGFDRLTERSREALAALDDPMSAMRELSRVAVRFACAERAVYMLMFDAPVFSGEVSPLLAAAVERFREVSRPPLDEAIRRKLVTGDAEALRRITWAAFHGLVALHLRGHLDEKQLERDVERMNDAIGFGILSDKARRKKKKGNAR
jgi:AcrR family transcriptional regulator